MAPADLWLARIAVKTLRRDQREAIAEVAVPLTPVRALELAVVNAGQLGPRYKCFFKRYMTVWNFELPDGR